LHRFSVLVDSLEILAMLERLVAGGFEGLDELNALDEETTESVDGSVN
jgi:hypothetical protein